MELASFRIIFILSLNFSHDRIIHPNRKRGEIKMREGKIVGAIKVLYDSSRKPTNFHLPKARTEEKEASFVSLLLSFFPTLSSLVRKIEDSRLTGNSADNPQSLASGQVSKSTAINKRDKSPRSIFHRRAISIEGGACSVRRCRSRLASILRSLTLSLSPPSPSSENRGLDSFARNRLGTRLITLLEFSSIV